MIKNCLRTARPRAQRTEFTGLEVQGEYFPYPLLRWEYYGKVALDTERIHRDPHPGLLPNIYLYMYWRRYAPLFSWRQVIAWSCPQKRYLNRSWRRGYTFSGINLVILDLLVYRPANNHNLPLYNVHRGLL